MVVGDGSDGPGIFSPGAGAQLLPPPCPGSLCLASVSLPLAGSGARVRIGPGFPSHSSVL